MRYILSIVLPPVAVWLSGRPFQAILNIVFCLLGWFPGVIHALFCTLIGTSIRKPKQVTQYIVEHFYDVQQKDYQAFEGALLTTAPRSKERDLVYALRISSIVPTVKTYKTLASRWDTANCGAGASGLEAGRSSSNHALVYNFLAGVYLARAERLLIKDTTALNTRLSKCATEKSRESAISKYCTKLSNYYCLFGYDLPNLAGLIQHYKTQAEQDASSDR